MCKKSKHTWLLKDPSFVPKKIRIRVFLFIIINLILICCLPLLAITIRFPYGILSWIMVICFLILFNIQAFYIHVERYPLNNYSEYKIDLKKDGILSDSTGHYIKVSIKGHIYEVQLLNKVLIFNMKGCFFPFTVIKAYLIRQFTIGYINKHKLVSDYMGKNIDITNLYDNYKCVKVVFNKRNKTCESYIIKDGKTKMNTLMRAINGHGFAPWHSGNAHGSSRYHFKISEQIFVKQKSKNISD
ncbi:hypothetical protein [Paracholeplasma manati]|uniref:hypothetical protein n=1 Tax=Paracholeplasma manati TaxID=591373 RepID=UPI0024078173|nr:hypothetical protein [Paracholeplasma manati]MDG0889312.1 hypothetical protein [Paracholeplasma manati]